MTVCALFIGWGDQVAIPVVPTVRVVVTFTKFVELQSTEQFFTPLSSPRHFVKGSSEDDQKSDTHYSPFLSSSSSSSMMASTWLRRNSSQSASKQQQQQRNSSSSSSSSVGHQQWSDPSIHGQVLMTSQVKWRGPSLLGNPSRKRERGKNVEF